jgi:hypothetical protein
MNSKVSKKMFNLVSSQKVKLTRMLAQNLRLTSNNNRINLEFKLIKHKSHYRLKIDNPKKKMKISLQ